MEINAAAERLHAARARLRTTPETAWARVERRGLPPRPSLHAAAGPRGKETEDGRSGGRNESEAVPAAGDAVSGGSAADGRRGVDRQGTAAEGESLSEGAHGVPGSVAARDGRRGSGEVGTKRQPTAPPAHHPPPKRRTLSARRQFPPGCGRDAATPLGRRADGGSRFRAAARADDDASDALDNPAVALRPRPPLADCHDGVLLGAECLDSASATGGLNTANGAESVAKSGRYVPATRMLAKRRTVSARRSFPPGCGRDAVPMLAVQVHVMVDSGRAVVAPPCPGATDAAAVHGDELEEGEILPCEMHPVAQEHPGSQFSVVVTLHQPAASGHGTSVPAIDAMEALVSPSSDKKISGGRIQCGEKRPSCEVEKDFKVLSSSARSSGHVATESSWSDLLSQECLRGTQMSKIAKMNKGSPNVAVRGSCEVAPMRSKVMFTPRKTVKTRKLIEKYVVDTQDAPLWESLDNENTLERHVVRNEIEDTDKSTEAPVEQALMLSKKRLMTKGNEDPTVKGYFGPRKKVKDQDNLPIIMLNPKCQLGIMEILHVRVTSNLDGDDILNGLAVCEGKLILYLKDSSHVPSMKCQRQYGLQNADVRNKVKMLCRRFEVICKTIAQAVDQRSLKIRRIDLAADKAIKELPDYFKSGPFVGEVPGVEAGDEFLYKVQLAIVGLHRPYQGGIDWINNNDDNLVAISVVASGGYPDRRSNSGELVYTGSGGKFAGRNASGDQKLERGNLALKNCIKSKSPVRVIHGFKGRNEESSHSRAREITTFTYDGLYHVVGCWIQGQPGSKVFKYKLQRIPGQSELPRGRKTGILS